MPKQHKIIVIAKERPFDEEKWKQLLTAFAYVLHERRKAQDENAHPDDTEHEASSGDSS